MVGEATLDGMASSTQRLMPPFLVALLGENTNWVRNVHRR